MSFDTLSLLLTRCQSLDVEYGDGMSMHLPMALGALTRMGASEARLHEFFARNVTHLSPLPPPLNPIDAANWQDCLGQRAQFAAYQQFFRTQLQRSGVAAVLRRYLPPLLSGVAAAAFHALIRLAYALDLAADIDHANEVAAALAWLASHYQTLGKADSKRAAALDGEPQALLQRLLNTEFAAWECATPLISARMSAAAATAAFAPVIDWLHIDAEQPEQSLRRLSICAAQLYLHSKNFTVLHMLTACHALRLVLPYLSEQAAALRIFWQAYAAAFLSSRVGTLPSAAGAAMPDTHWAQILENALASENEHVIKLTYTCCEEYQVWRAPIYWQVAAGLMRADKE